MSTFRTAVVLAATAALFGCEREMRRFESPPHDVRARAPGEALQPGPAVPPPFTGSTATGPGERAAHPNEHNAFDVAQGKRWFRWYNCAGCHANGGGGMGPALMDAEWRYGDAPEAVAASIVQGRPNGMPAFGGRIPDAQVGQLVAYVRSLSGALRIDVAPGRSDALGPAIPESRRETPPPRQEARP